MTAELSRRIGFVWGRIKNANPNVTFKQLDDALVDIEIYNTFEELPNEIQQWVINTEKKFGKRPNG